MRVMKLMQNIGVECVKFVSDVLQMCIHKKLCLMSNFTSSKDEYVAVLLTIFNHSRIKKAQFN